MPRTMKYNGETLTIRETQYALGGLAVIALDAEGFPYATLSVYLEGETENLPNNAFFLKDYSENAAIAAAFLASVKPLPLGISARTGYAIVHAYSLDDSDAETDASREVLPGVRFTDKSEEPTHCWTCDSTAPNCRCDDRREADYLDGYLSGYAAGYY